MKEPMSLADIAKLALDRHGASGRRLSALAHEHGHVISHTTLNGIAAGTYRSKPTDATIQGLAFLAGVPVDRVYSLAGVTPPLASFAHDLPPGADRLTAEQRQAVLGVIREFVRSNEEAGTTTYQSAGIYDADLNFIREVPWPPLDLAARTGDVEDVDPALRDE